MDVTHWTRIEAVFHEVVDVPAGAARDVLLAQLCEGDTGLTDAVSELLIEDARLRGVEVPADPHLGLRLGSYQVDGLIARGGMGVVYDAHRADDEFQQRVAIKIMDLRLSDPALVAQFKAERQILAALEHPALTRLLDGGVTALGEPYLVMEYVDGLPIDRYCDAQRLDVAARLSLFAQVCDGVSFAHGNLVLHRDLKPSNVLVTAQAHAKVVDFGTAVLLQPERLATVSPAPLTPAYASPEQLTARAVGTASDQYSLGLLLYELLTGVSPFGDRPSMMAAVERALSGAATTAPHAVVTAEAATARATTLATLRRQLAGDLGTIVGKALAHDPSARYASVQHLQDDLARWDRGEPILGRPPSLFYRVGKLVVRRKLETAAVTFALAALVAGLTAAILQAQRADAQSRRATEVTRFLTTMLGSADPGELGKDVTVREVLVRASQNATALEQTPQLAADVRGVIGRTFVALGDYQAAEGQLRSALAAERRADPGGSIEAVRLLVTLSQAQESDGRLEDAAHTLDDATAALQRHPNAQASVQVSYFDQRARILSRQGDFPAAIPLYEKALALARAEGLESEVRAEAAANLGFALSNVGRHRESLTHYAEAVAETRATAGPAAVEVANRLSPYATALWFAGEREHALSVYEEALAIRRSTQGVEHPEYAWTLANYADSLISMHQYERAVPLAREVLALRGRTLEETHPMVPFAMGLLGRALGPLGKLAEAERWLRESLALRQRTMPAGHWTLASSRSLIGEHLVLAKRFVEAERLLLDAERDLVGALGDKAPVVADTRRRLVDLYTAWNRPADAQSWRERAPKEAP